MSKLVDMNFDEVSFVKKGANQYSKVSIAKSLESEEKNMSGELFNEDGSVVDPEDLNEGDVVFDQEGNEFKVTAEADDNDDDDDDDDDDASVDEFGKALPLGANMRRQAMRFGRRNKQLVHVPGKGSAGGNTRHSFSYNDLPGRERVGPFTGAKRDFKRGAKIGSKVRERGGRANTPEFNLGGIPSRLGYATTAPSTGARYAAAGGAGVAGGGAIGYESSRRNRDVGKSLREEFSKALTDEDRDQIITKAFDQMEEFQLQAEYAAEIAKSEQDARVFNEYVGIAKSYTLPFDDDELAYAMMEAESNLSPESAEIVAKAFDLASNAIETEIGYEGFDGPSVMNEVGDFMEEIGKSDDPDAFLQLMESNPELYDEYLNEQQN